MKKNNRSKKTTKRSEEKSFLVRFIRRVFFAVFFVVLLLLSLYFFVFPSIVKNDLSEKNIVIVSNKLDSNSSKIYLAHVSQEEKENKVFVVDAEQEINVPGGYGEYPLQSVYQLLLIDKKDTQFIKSVYSELLGIAVDEVVAVNSPLNDVSESELSQFFLSSIFKNINVLNTNNFSAIKLHYQAKNMSIVEIEAMSDIKKYYNELSTISGDLYQYCSVAVINGTGKNGLARKVGDSIENTGALVVRLDDSEVMQTETEIYYADNPVDCSVMAEKISGIFSEKPKIIPIDKLENSQQYRAKTVVFIGDSIPE